MDVAHGDGRDQVPVQHGRARKGHPVGSNDARLVRLGERRRKCRDLVGLFAAVPGKRASHCVKQQILGVLPGGVWNLVVGQRRCEPGQLLGHIDCHWHLLAGG